MGSTPDSKSSGSSSHLKLGHEFYRRGDVLKISRELLGKSIFTHLPLHSKGKSERVLCGGVIVETEAYAGPTDRASHAYGKRRTPRTEIMYHDGGVAYVYLCYGIHSLFNIITNVAGIPHAVLIRAVEPINGIEHMQKRRGISATQRRLTAGPGALSKAMGICAHHNSLDLTGTQIWIEHRQPDFAASDIVASPRVGIGYAGPDADKPWRFRVRGNAWTSPAK